MREKLVHKFLLVDFKNVLLKRILFKLKITLQRYIIRLRLKKFELFPIQRYCENPTF